MGPACGPRCLPDSRDQTRTIGHRQHDLVERVVLQTNPHAGLAVMGNGEGLAALRAPGPDLGTTGHTQSGSSNSPDDSIGLGHRLDVPNLHQRSLQVAMQAADLLSTTQPNAQHVRAHHKLYHRCLPLTVLI